jgi:hypothetical protein
MKHNERVNFHSIQFYLLFQLVIFSSEGLIFFDGPFWVFSFFIEGDHAEIFIGNSRQNWHFLVTLHVEFSIFHVWQSVMKSIKSSPQSIPQTASKLVSHLNESSTRPKDIKKLPFIHSSSLFLFKNKKKWYKIFYNNWNVEILKCKKRSSSFFLYKKT